jgi:hypothetical protein
MNDSQTRISRGQAFNLAINAAIASGKQEDKKYITTMFLKYYDMAVKFQEAGEADIKRLIKELNDD